ncbi:hypothetical protein BGZ49_002636 [Haplosporangium sp. Z 27]|nr:hypothetical protein BGZ49_002636 [Haplosporangium sp. Z 27]
MPVTFSPSDIPLEQVGLGAELQTPQELFQKACPDQYNISEEILQSSFAKGNKSDIIGQHNGFVLTLSEAYNRHHGLIIRPDDVWMAILVQFNYFVNANSKVLRKQFVAHDNGQKTLVVTAIGNRKSKGMDFGRMAQQMTKEMDRHIIDPSLREWILPGFTTTTDKDRIVCSVVMMATMKKYFRYVFSLKCGLPWVRLEGEKADWEEILMRLEKLKEFGTLTTAWYFLLRPVISRFVKAFDEPTTVAVDCATESAVENLDFWNKVCHRSGRGSGPRYLSGWVTAFCVFDEDGKWIGRPIDKKNGSSDSLSAEDLFGKHATNKDNDNDDEYLVLDGAPYHHVDTARIPNGYAEVEVLIDDNGTEIPAKMVAGHIGMQVYSDSISESIDKEKKPRTKSKRNTVMPASGWWIFTTLPDGQVRKKHKKK